MKLYFITFIVASLIFFIIDFIWLSITVKTIYRPILGDMILDKPILWAAFLFYVMYIIGLTILVLIPSINADSLYKVFGLGFVFGFVAYGTYNLTNMAVLKNWSPTIVVIDMFWGGILTGLTSTVTIFIIKNYFK
mgnify:CR=1 FL=1